MAIGWHAGSDVMWTESNLPEMIRRDENTRLAIGHGLLRQVVDESLAQLRAQPYDVQAVESMLRAQWRAGDMLGALQSVRRALELNPHEPGYRFMRGLLHQSVGMLRDAMEDYEAALVVAESDKLRASIAGAVRALEDWQLSLVQLLLAEDRSFRLEFARNPEAAIKKRGFALTHLGKCALTLIRPSQRAYYAGLS